MKSTIKKFSDKFVNKNLQTRIEHEFQNKPGKLYERICHDADSLFQSKFKNSSIEFDENEICYIFRGGKPELVKFHEANRFLGNGDGVLIVSENGQKFIAETEYQKGYPSEIFSGS
jgi:hypothetical protein